MLFCITDIETTGGRNTYDNITEIASILTDGTQILDRFETLVKPDNFIPRNITLLTGISNDMVANAPTFDEVAQKWLAFAKDAVFVAHNVGFDLGFIGAALERRNISYQPKKLCTVRLSRKIIPGHKTYSLGKICHAVGIKIDNRHRAMGDTEATTQLFHLLVAQDKNKFIQTHLDKQKKAFALPPYLDESEYDKLPMQAGVYYLKDKNKKPLYIGKAKNIKTRVRTHFRTANRLLLENLHSIDFQLTGTDLLASIVESDEIKKYWPPYNAAQKFPSNTFTISTYQNRNNEWKLAIVRSKNADLSPLFGSQYSTRVYLQSWIAEYDLCPRLSGLQETCPEADCPCKNKEEHNDLLLGVADKMKHYLPSFCLVDEGKTTAEKSLLWVQEGAFKGIAYVNEIPNLDTQSLKALITPMKEHPETAAIIGQFLSEYMESEKQHKKYIHL